VSNRKPDPEAEVNIWLDGIVVRGAGRGRDIGFPTANIQLGAGLARPADGIYAGCVQVLPGSKMHPAAIHVGPVPTFDEETPTVEAHIIDWPDQDLYDRAVRVQLIQRLRGVEKFSSVAALQEALQRDVEQARAVLAE